ncbi:uncharacterized protein L203_100947 [Cryptococcus depauperatus CBS 7841]|uniref:Transcriptional adapter 2 n=1 Tax=Cryptococcus depauperatus CBS 7841 TaxID=1295531 RepID=A0A1E3I9D5_9TREE|nr:transcriptional adapter 2-alpha [Cryptococcus depauperatus CBS 7841]
MTVTQRRSRVDNTQSDSRPIIEPGIKYTCDFCHVDITHTVRIKCAMKQCEEVDICPNCFCEGKEGLQHKAWHDYMVAEQNSQPIFTPDWGADEELLLISGLIQNGLGNWAEVAQHVGTRTKEECEKHYTEVYLGVGEDGSDLRAEEKVGDLQEESEEGTKRRRKEFMPPMDRVFPYDPDEFQQCKKARIEELRKPHALPPSNVAPPVSAPTNHEVAGYMPARLEFEHEVDNDAEMAVKDMEFGVVYGYGGDEQPLAKITRPPDEEEAEEVTEDPDGEEDKAIAKEGKVKKDKKPEKEPPLPDIEDPDELEVKLSMMDIYFSKLDNREDAKELIFDRGLTEYRTIQTQEKKLSKEDRELLQRYKPLAKIQTAEDFELFIDGLMYEQALRRRIAELQEYRRMGVTTAAEAEVYDNVKLTRAMDGSLSKSSETLSTGARINAGQHRFLHGAMGTPPPEKNREHTPRAPPAAGRKPPQPLNLANSASLDLLSSEEQSLCSILRVLPKPYLTIKELYIRENERRKGLLRRRDARKMLNIDVNKSGRIFDFMVQNGMLVLAYEPQGKKGGSNQYAMATAIGLAETNIGGDHNKEILMERVNGLGMTNGVNKPLTTEIRLSG